MILNDTIKDIFQQVKISILECEEEPHSWAYYIKNECVSILIDEIIKNEFPVDVKISLNPNGYTIVRLSYSDNYHYPGQVMELLSDYVRVQRILPREKIPHTVE